MGDNNTSDGKKKKHKIRDTSPTGRGTENRGIQYRPESNAFEPAVIPEVSGKRYKLTGLPTSYAGTGKPGVAKGLDDIYEQWRNAPGSELHVTGSTSKSVVPGVDDEELQRKRAVAVKDYFVKKGVPPSQIRTRTFGSNNLDPRAISPESKAAMRGATIEIVKPEPLHPPPHPLGNYPDPINFVEAPRPWYNSPPAKVVKKPKVIRRAEPPLVTQDGVFNCWAASLSSWLSATPTATKKEKQSNFERVYGADGIDVEVLQTIADTYGMRTAVIQGAAEFTPERIQERLEKVSHLLIGFRLPAEEENWWHVVVLYGVEILPSGEPAYLIMDPGPMPEVANLVSLIEGGRIKDEAQLLKVQKKYFFRPGADGRWLIGFSKRPRPLNR